MRLVKIPKLVLGEAKTLALRDRKAASTLWQLGAKVFHRILEPEMVRLAEFLQRCMEYQTGKPVKSDSDVTIKPGSSDPGREGDGGITFLSFESIDAGGDDYNVASMQQGLEMLSNSLMALAEMAEGRANMPHTALLRPLDVKYGTTATEIFNGTLARPLTHTFITEDREIIRTSMTPMEAHVKTVGYLRQQTGLDYGVKGNYDSLKAIGAWAIMDIIRPGLITAAIEPGPPITGFAPGISSN